LRELPEQKFQLYRQGWPSADLNNWLLEWAFARWNFRADWVVICTKRLSDLDVVLEQLLHLLSTDNQRESFRLWQYFNSVLAPLFSRLFFPPRWRTIVLAVILLRQGAEISRIESR